MSTAEQPDARSRPRLDEATVRRVHASDDVVAVFCNRAEELGMHVHHTSATTVAQDVAVLVCKLADLVPSADPPIVAIDPTTPCHKAIGQALSACAKTIDPPTGDEAIYAAHVGITGVTAAIAETGSLVCTSQSAAQLSTSLIPPVHIAVVRVEQIVPDLLDWFTGLSAPDLPANVTLISGPSKTADIEGILITGVHGPGDVHILLIAGGSAHSDQQ